MNCHRTIFMHCFLILSLMTGCNRGPEAPADKPPVIPVSLPVEKEVTDYADYTSEITAIDSVEIRARVWGYLDKIDFEEGKLVTKGAVLYEIDPRSYKAVFDARKAEVAQNEASLELARVTNERFKGLAKKDSGAVSQLELDKYKAQEEQARANLDLAKANLETARLNLEWTKVTAPISGRIGRRLVTVGNIVQSADQPTVTLLTTIVSVDPVYALFDVDQNTVEHVRHLIAQGKAKSARDMELPVTMGLSIDKGFPHKGIVDFVDNKVLPKTGTLKLRAVFPNHPEILTPGFFCRVRVPLGFPHQALLVTERAIDTDQGQRIVYVINKDNKVEVRPIRTGLLHDGLREVLEGIKAGDQVVVNGLQQIRAEMVVEPKVVDMPRSGVGN